MWMPMEAHGNKTRELSELKEAFESFNFISGELQTSYRDLQNQVASLQDQLAEAERVSAEQADRNCELAQRLAALLEALPSGVVMLDDGGIIRVINSAATNLLGKPLQDTAWQSVCRRAFEDQTSEQGDLTLVDGRRISLAQKPMAPEPGRVLLLTDVTENRKFQELLDRHRRLAAMGEMAAALAHQIRTPLSAALLYTSNASRPELSADNRRDLLDKATNCLTDLEQLISDMLQFARGVRYADSSFTVDELLSAVERTLRPVLMNNQVLEISLPDSVVEINGNCEALVGAVQNLVNNALQSAGENARVNISVSTTGAWMDLRVVDNGPGIEADQIDKIFDPFYTSRPNGTGLGLAVVKSVAKSHGGFVSVEQTDRPGATFVLRIPVNMTAMEEHRPRLIAAEADKEFTEGTAA